MLEAARDGDEAGFSSYIDYPALRADMKAELTAKLQAEAKRDPSPQGRLGLAVSMALLGPMVDRMVSPGAMESAFAQLADENRRREGAGAAGTAGKADKAGRRTRMPDIRREGLNRFVVAARDRPDSGLIFERRGLGWRLTGIDLPRGMTVAAERR